MNRLRCLTYLLPVTLLACGGADTAETGENSDTAGTVSPDGTRDSDFDREELQSYRAAVPSPERLSVAEPGAATDPSALTLAGNAELAKLAAASAITINAGAVLSVAVLKFITAFPPTLYDSAEQRYVWGPWDNDEGYGSTLAYVQRNPDGADFEYGYGLVRLDGEDIDRSEVVVMGGGTPGDKDGMRHADYGVGVTVWDFEADHEFEKQYDPDYDPDETRDAGRFAMVFGKGENDDGRFAFNVAVFRDFISKKDAAKGDTQPGDLDYFYGHFVGKDDNELDFVDWRLLENFCGDSADKCFEEADAEDLSTGNEESLTLRAAFLNRGIGRAEVSLSGGDLPSDVDVVECWDANIDRAYFSVDENGEPIAETGSCLDPFAASLSDLGIPTLDDVDAEMLSKMDCVTRKGAQACDL